MVLVGRSWFLCPAPPALFYRCRSTTSTSQLCRTLLCGGLLLLLSLTEYYLGDGQTNSVQLVLFLLSTKYNHQQLLVTTKDDGCSSSRDDDVTKPCDTMRMRTTTVVEKSLLTHESPPLLCLLLRTTNNVFVTQLWVVS